MKIFQLLLWLAAFGSLSANARINLTGVVVNESNAVLPGATINLLNTHYTAVTDENGLFQLEVSGAGEYYMKISAAGYATTITTVHVGDTTSALKVTLYPHYKRLDEVTVRAQKAEEDNSRLPISLTALSAEQIEEYRIWDIKDLTAIAPNLYLADPGDRRNVASIRGITTTSYDPAIATYVDGVSQFGLDSYIPQLFDVEQVEVLRGPQGTLYGRNAMGGVINIITKQPDNNRDIFAQASAGNYGLLRSTAGIRTPLIKDKLFAGVAGLYEKSDGYYTNEFDGTQYDRQRSIGGNYYLKYRVNPQWMVSLNLKHVSNRNHGAFPLVMGAEEAIENPYLLNQNARTLMVDNLLNTSISINHAGRGLNFSSQTSYQYNHRYYEDPIDADFSPLDGMSIINDFGKDWNKYSVITQEFRISSPTRLTPFSWTAGSFLFSQKNPVRQATRFGADALMMGAPDTAFSLINTTISEGTGAAAFGQATLRLNRFSITAGLRYDYERKAQTIGGSYLKGDNMDSALVTRTDTTATTDFNALSPKLSVTYELSGSSMMFLSYNRGFRAGGLSPMNSDPSVPPLYEYMPEYSDNIELGMKSSFLNNRIRLYVTGFYSLVTDVQLPTLILPDAVTVTRNTGELRSKGAEAEVRARIIAGLEGTYSFGYTDARYEQLKVSSGGEEKNYEGNRQVFTPEVTSMLALQYKVALDKKQTLFFQVRGEWQYLGRQYFDLANTIQQPSYQLFNTRIGVEYNAVSIMLWGRNLADQRYISYAYDFGAVHLGNPRTYGVTAGIRL